MMWAYRDLIGKSGYEVGFYTPGNSWIFESDWVTKTEAAARVNYLNGGTGESFERRLR